MVLVDKDTRVIVRGITGRQGTFHSARMKEYATNIVAGITPGKGGQEVNGIPVFNSAKEALEKHEADWSILFVPAPFTKAAALEDLESGLNLVVITEGVPVLDTLDIVDLARKKNLKVIGPNTPGILSVGKSKIGIMPNGIFKKGDVGVISRSGTLTYEVVTSLVKHGIGQSTVVGIGGDKVVGTNFVDMLKMFEEDNETKKIVMIGEIGGNQEEKAAEYIKDNVSKPVVAYIAGVSAPKGKAMGHAGAIIYGNAGTAESKINALESAGVKVAKTPYDVHRFL